MAGELGQSSPGRLSLKGVRDEQTREAAETPHARRGGAIHPLRQGGGFCTESAAGAGSLQKTHGISAECVEALCLSPRDRGDAVEPQQQGYARFLLSARPIPKT